MTTRWKFGQGQTHKQEVAEISATKAAGLDRQYMKGQELSRMIEAETERRRHGKRTTATKPAPAETVPSVALPTPAEVNAARTRSGGWTRATLAGWGVPCPPPKGWRQVLERERTGQGERPRDWSSPVRTVKRAA